MVKFKIHDLESAPEGSKPLLEAAKKKFGLIPNITSLQAESPALIKAYFSGSAAFGESGLSPAEQQTILMSANFANGCNYCLAAHTGGALAAGVNPEDVEALRKGGELSDPKLNALSTLTKKMVAERGWVKDEDLEAFLATGYTKADIMHVILGISLKTMTHYLNHIADTPLDEAFEKFKL